MVNLRAQQVTPARSSLLSCVYTYFLTVRGKVFFYMWERDEREEGEKNRPALGFF